MKNDILPKTILFDDEAQAKIQEAVAKVYQVAKVAYGPKAGNVLLEQNWPIGQAKLSRDGVTNLRKIALKDRTENMAAKVIIQASEKNNASVGDGTTAAAILACYFYNEARKLVGSGFNRMEVSAMINDSALRAIEYVDSISHVLTDDNLLHVAQVASGDNEIAQLLADTVEEVGSEGGITVEEHSGLGVMAEVIDGFYMRKGYADVRLVQDGGTLSSDFHEVPVLLLEKTITSGKEIATILSKIKAARHNEVLILGDVIQEALEVLIRQRIENVMTPTLVPIPATSGMKSIVLDDVALLTGGRVYQSGHNASSFNLDFLGAAERVLVDELSTTIVGGAGDEEAIKKRINELESQLLAEHHPVTVSALKDRIARLKGKVGVVKVGAPTDIDREELRLRVDDAVCALQAARRGGTVPGGGTALARVTGTKFDHVFQKLFLDLMDNAGERGELRLDKLLEKPVGYGYDLKNMTDEPIDLRDAGVLDPTLVIKEVVRNAASVSSKLITVGATIAYENDLMELKK